MAIATKGRSAGRNAGLFARRWRTDTAASCSMRAPAEHVHHQHHFMVDARKPQPTGIHAIGDETHSPVEPLGPRIVGIDTKMRLLDHHARIAKHMSDKDFCCPAPPRFRQHIHASKQTAVSKICSRLAPETRHPHGSVITEHAIRWAVHKPVLPECIRPPRFLFVARTESHGRVPQSSEAELP